MNEPLDKLLPRRRPERRGRMHGAQDSESGHRRSHRSGQGENRFYGENWIVVFETGTGVVLLCQEMRDRMPMCKQVMVAIGLGRVMNMLGWRDRQDPSRNGEDG